MEKNLKLPHYRVLTRLRPSKRHGVGVFAIRNIRKGTKLFSDDLEEMMWVEKSKVKRLPNEVRKLYEDFAVLKDGRFGCPRNFNRLTMSWYMNDSRHPNVRCLEGYDFEALRYIKAGEELTVNYSTYSDKDV
jgi:SET domain-containing protein